MGGGGGGGGGGEGGYTTCFSKIFFRHLHMHGEVHTSQTTFHHFSVAEIKKNTKTSNIAHESVITDALQLT